MAKTNCSHLIQITIYLPDALLPGVDSPEDTQDSEHNIIIRDAIFRVVIKSRGWGFYLATKRGAPCYFYWKIEEK